MEETPSNGNEHPGNGIVPRNGGRKSRGSPSRGMARWNALKHGVLSQGAVLPTEDRAQFEELHKNLREDLKPEGALEELLVERIAICFWRLRRILRYDFGIKEGNDFKLRSGKEVWIAKLEKIDKLTSVRQQIAQNGANEKMKKAVAKELNLAVDPSTVSDELLLSLANQGLAQLRESLPAIKADVEAFALESALAGKRTDTLLRYETANERQLYRALDQLERLQRQRAGDYVPPPVKLGISSDV